MLSSLVLGKSQSDKNGAEEGYPIWLQQVLLLATINNVIMCDAVTPLSLHYNLAYWVLALLGFEFASRYNLANRAIHVDGERNTIPHSAVMTHHPRQCRIGDTARLSRLASVS